LSLSLWNDPVFARGQSVAHFYVFNGELRSPGQIHRRAESFGARARFSCYKPFLKFVILNAVKNLRVFLEVDAAEKSEMFRFSQHDSLYSSEAPLAMHYRQSQAFTLIELLVVITIIVVLMGLLFPAFRGVQDQAKRTQAKNDLTQIVTAVTAFYAEYGKYPLPPGATGDTIYGPTGTSNAPLFTELRGLTSATQNPKQVVFLSPPDAKDPANPRSGIGTTTGAGQFFDPWGIAYDIEIDGDYDNQITTNPYSSNAGSSPLRQSVIAWSLGKDQRGGSGDKKIGDAEDDVISWQ